LETQFVVSNGKDREEYVYVDEDGGPKTIRAAGAPSLRQYELDQVHRVTALRVAFNGNPRSVSQPLVGTPRVNADRLRGASRLVNGRPTTHCERVS
jgi:hypothetical protein